MNPNADEPQLPDALVDDLAQLYGADVRANPALDQAFLSRAHAHLAKRRRFIFTRRAGAVAAAVALIAGVLIPVLNRLPHRVGPVATRVPADINADGVVDIRDAFVLQRGLEAGQAARVDLNGDGVTDRRDVDAVAMIAVRMDREAVR
jgi:hypothetical protein